MEIVRIGQRTVRKMSQRSNSRDDFEESGQWRPRNGRHLMQVVHNFEDSELIRVVPRKKFLIFYLKELYAHILMIEK